MQLKVFRSLWGLEDLPAVEDKLRYAKEAGYEGVEGPIPAVPPQDWKTSLQQHGLQYIGMVFADDVDAFQEQLEAIQPYNPILINAHGGRDRMEFRDGCRYLLQALKAEREMGIPVAHETHRGRLFYAPWVTVQYVQEFPDVKLCADFSHWCVVCESLLEEHEEAVELACEHTVHIHARVGYEEGPQAPDPRAPEYELHLNRFESWWDKIREARKAAGAPYMTATPEFGPPQYLHTLPYTRQPVADLSEICLWMTDRLRKRWRDRH